MKKFLIRLVFEVKVNECHDHFDEQWRLVERYSQAEALEAAIKMGGAESSTFGSADGSIVEWVFVHLADCIDLSGHPAGGLLLSLSSYPEDAPSYRAFVKSRGEEILSKNPTFAATG